MQREAMQREPVVYQRQQVVQADQAKQYASSGGDGATGAIVGSVVAGAAALVPLFLMTHSKSGGKTAKTKVQPKQPVQQTVRYGQMASPYRWPLIIGGLALVGVTAFLFLKE